MTPVQARTAALALASRTGWSMSEILALPVSHLMWWLEGIPDE